jgi:hypothetical protein
MLRRGTIQVVETQRSGISTITDLEAVRTNKSPSRGRADEQRRPNWTSPVEHVFLVPAARHVRRVLDRS